MMTKRRLTLGLGVVVGLAVAAIGMFNFMPLKVEVAQAEHNVPVQVFGLGTVEARIQSAIGFQANGTLIELSADQGQKVREGDVLARLDDREQQARLAKAAAGITNARAMLESAEAGLVKAQTVLKLKESINTRRQTLFKTESTTKEVADQALTEAQSARADVQIAESNITIAKAGLENAQAEYDYQKVLLDNFALSAPYDALIVERTKELGTVLNVGEPLFKLVKADTVWVLGYIDESRAGHIEIGQKAEIHLRSRPGRVFAGHVVRIDIESDRTNEERRVYAVCDECPEQFHLGEQAELTFTVATLETAVLVPEIAVDARGARRQRGDVWVVNDGELKRRTVGFGHQTLDARLEIISGLEAGDEVVIKRIKGLKEGRAVTVSGVSEK
jgi:HlyD family secretion protein